MSTVEQYIPPHGYRVRIGGEPHWFDAAKRERVGGCGLCGIWPGNLLLRLRRIGDNEIWVCSHCLWRRDADAEGRLADGMAPKIIVKDVSHQQRGTHCRL